MPPETTSPIQSTRSAVPSSFPSLLSLSSPNLRDQKVLLDGDPARVYGVSTMAKIEKTLIGHDIARRDLYQKIRPLLLPPPEPKRREIGFHARRENPSGPKGAKK